MSAPKIGDAGDEDGEAPPDAVTAEEAPEKLAAENEFDTAFSHHLQNTESTASIGG